ncbi:hypothetical protein HF086_006018 [Spodoptera exigua]|uniref:Uncharacterized protein n=1 Tax=Spodoptera exigua TaxID=7107 RepID=A0A922MVZ1_SPOEX|nr:hypothetical protein HF086_006018 [Spodoptera exigua]
MFFKSIAQAFVDFNELYPCGPLQLQMGVIAGNIAMYLECLAPEALGPLGACAALVSALDALLRAAALLLHQLDDVLPLLRAATAALRIPAAAQHKVLSPYCTRSPPPSTPGHGCRLVLPPQLAGGELASGGTDAREVAAGAVDCMRPHLPDMIDLLQDPHLLNKIKGSVSKSIVNRNLICLNEDTLGAIVKGGIAQYVAMELALEHSRGRQDRAQPARHMTPWISTSLPGCREVCECVSRVRVVSWLVMGALCNAAQAAPSAPAPPHAPPRPPHMPVPQDATCHITDYIQVHCFTS